MRLILLRSARTQVEVVVTEAVSDVLEDASTPSEAAGAEEPGIRTA